jgi:hypothetical protein
MRLRQRTGRSLRWKMRKNPATTNHLNNLSTQAVVPCAEVSK